MNEAQPTLQARHKNKELKFGKESREKLLEGIDIIANAVKATLGPRGRNVVIEQTRTVGLMQNQIGLMPRITKDGVSVAREINVEDKFQNLGVQIVKEVATRQNEQAGDGTTTATVLAQAIAHSAMSAINNGKNPITIKKDIDANVKMAIDFIASKAQPVESLEELESIATISANGDKEVGSIVSRAVQEVGHYGIISVETAPIMEMELDFVEGMEFPAGFAAPQFITNQEKNSVEYKDARILFFDSKINDIKDLVKIMEMTHSKEQALVIICEDMASDVMATLVYNKVKNGLQVVVLKLPEYLPSKLDFMEDLATITSGTVISNESGYSLGAFKEEFFGKCDRIRANQELTEFIGGHADVDRYKARVAQLETQFDAMSKEDKGYDLVKSRLAKLSGGIAVIRVGGSSEIDIGERKDRIEDAINATKAAVEDGIVTGGGSMLLRTANYIQNNMVENLDGKEIVVASLQSPFLTILENAGFAEEEATEILIKTLSSDREGFNVDKEEYCDFFEAGVIDPAKVVKNALKDAANVVGLLITTEVGIVNKGDE